MSRLHAHDHPCNKMQSCPTTKEELPSTAPLDLGPSPALSCPQTITNPFSNSVVLSFQE